MTVRLDDLDRKILAQLQQDGGLSLDEIAGAVGSSKTPVWNRIRKMREAGVIRQQTYLLDPEALGLEACFFASSARQSMMRAGRPGFSRRCRNVPKSWKPTGWRAISTIF